MSGFNEAAEKMMQVFDEKNVQNAQAIQRVREIHIADPLYPNICNVCLDFYPCPTIKALVGEQTSKPAKLTIALDPTKNVNGTYSTLDGEQ